MKILFQLCFFISALNGKTIAQGIEHNYPVAPQNTNCDSLGILPDDYPDALLKIENASWRYQRSFSISRQHGLRQARFFSCDAETGFLITHSDSTKCIFHDVPLKAWEELTKSPDPESFLAQFLGKNFISICEDGK
ncbi:MAG TPA: hypothetical protein VI583_09200 [Cyclobacteriaceae bacterium]|nr:hypothetical protein [Cyclobacteriaceae bacterium]